MATEAPGEVRVVSKERREENIRRQKERAAELKAERKIRSKGATTRDEAEALGVLKARGWKALVKR
jgi:hypothetical protein